MTYKNIKNNKGIVFIEVLVSMAIVMLASLAFLQAVKFSMLMKQKVHCIYMTSMLAEQRIEYLKAMSLDVFSRPSNYVENKVSVNDKGEKDNKGNYYRTTKIDEYYGIRKKKIEIILEMKSSEKSLKVPFVIETFIVDPNLF